MMILGGFLASGAYACNRDRWDPVDPLFCEDNPFPLPPPSSPYVEFDARTAYGVYVLADGTRVTADFGRGTVTMLFPNLTMQVALVSQLEPAIQEQFWKVARYAADNPNASVKVPVDRIPSMIERASNATSQPATKRFGDEDEESNCKPALDKVLPCVQVTAPTFYYSWFYQDWRPARPGELFQAGTIFCQFGDNRSMCADYLRVHREDWEKERQSSCRMAGYSALIAAGGVAAAPQSCAATGAALLAMATGVGTVPGAVTFVGAGIVCAGASVAAIGGVALAVHELGKCQASYPGPGR